MSEYQYYEFRTINRQLTSTERKIVNGLSSHGNTTATSFSVDYSWSDFKHDTDQVLVRYFDAFFYIANWGTVILKFRYPKELVDTRAWEPYCIEEEMTINHQTVDDSVILSFNLNMEDGGFGWLEPQGSMDGLLNLYQDILQGDHRVLYLAWLRAIQEGESYREAFDEETLEPPLPLGLSKLSSALNSFAALFVIEKDLIAAAAAASDSAIETTPVDEMAALITLSKAECIEFLQRLLQGEAHLELKLKQRLGLLQPATGYDSTGQRTVGELLKASAEAEALRKKAAAEAEALHQKAVAAAKAAKRRARLQALADRGDLVWQEVEDLIKDTKSADYKEAAKILRQLGELAREQGKTMSFESRIAQIRSRYNRRPAFMRELNKQQL